MRQFWQTFCALRILLLERNSSADERAGCYRLPHMRREQSFYDPTGDKRVLLDVSDFFGEGIWLMTMQAHSLQEGEQLLLLNMDGS
jgi:hypothetical protein